MNQDEILENNKLIADFMDVKIGVEQYSWRIGCQEPLQEKHLNYHASWGWIMPVIERIETMDYGFKMCRKVIEVYIDSTKAVLFKVKKENRMASAYTAIIQFVKWYNELNKQP